MIDHRAAKEVLVAEVLEFWGGEDAATLLFLDLFVAGPNGPVLDGVIGVGEVVVGEAGDVQALYVVAFDLPHGGELGGEGLAAGIAVGVVVSAEVEVPDLLRLGDARGISGGGALPSTLDQSLHY